MRKFIFGLGLGIIIGGLVFTYLLPLIKKKPIDGVFLAFPPQLNTSVDFRNDGTMFMASNNDGEWFKWRIEQGRIIALAKGEKYKGKEIVFTIKGDELFLGNIRFQKQK
jgi:hypothetical protein